MRSSVATVLMGLVALFFVIYEWDFRSRAYTGQAIILEGPLFGRSGLTTADVLVVTEGRKIRATLRDWFCYVRPGQQIGILYFPSDPKNVVADWFWQRHYCSTIALAVFAIFAAVETTSRIEWRLRQDVALLRDDYVPPRFGSRRTPSLPIDTKPRLWDRELDG